MDQLKKRAQNLDIIGHRGGFEPGNTMKSLEKAKEFGLKKVEIDIELSKDSIPFVLHAGFRGEMDSFVKERGHFVIIKLYIIKLCFNNFITKIN